MFQEVCSNGVKIRTCNEFKKLPAEKASPKEEIFEFLMSNDWENETLDTYIFFMDECFLPTIFTVEW